jgi:predicted nucleic acid-binding protein
VIIDDWKGRNVAEQLGVLVTGTLGVIIKSKKKGIIPSIKPFLAKIQQTNFRLSDALESVALKEAGEDGR